MSREPSGHAHLAVFAKFWEPGQVKTRLGATIGAEAAAHVYRAMLDATLARMTGIADRHVLAYSPEERHAEFAAVIPAPWELVPQRCEELGNRLVDHMIGALCDGADRIVIIGSDSPTLPVDYVRDAFTRLEKSDVVVGPAEDGGFYLFGAGHCAPDIFEGIEWSTDHVFVDVEDRLLDSELSYEVLPMWYDVDDADDLQRAATDGFAWPLP